MTDELPPLPEATIRTDMHIDGWGVVAYDADQMRAYAAAAVAREREACASVCDEHASIEGIAQQCAAAIRSR